MQEYCNQTVTNHFNKMLLVSISDEEAYNNSQIYSICNEKLDASKVRDHCHITGKYRGAAHSICNLKLKIPRKLPITVHNLEGYDEHIIFKEFNNFNVDIQVIPKTAERCMNIVIDRNIIFLDSIPSIKVH